MSPTIKVAIATPLDPGLRHLVTDVDPSVDLLVDDALLPPQRFPGDHEGDPGFRRTHRQQARFDRLLSRADVFYGVPDTKPAALAPAVRANPDLRWVLAHLVEETARHAGHADILRELLDGEVGR